MAIPVPSDIKQYAHDDIERALERIRDRHRIEIECNNITFETDPMEDELRTNGGNYDTALDVIATAELHSGDNFNQVTMYSWDYFIGDGDIFFDGIREITSEIESELKKNGYIRASVKASRKITADEDIPEEYDETPSGDFSDQLDTMADNIEDMKDSFDEITEDDPNIEIDNNITDHYIAECEKCHGVFISAVVESDQEVQSVTGTCPLCGKESEQLLKWIVRSANEDAFDDVDVNPEAL